MQSAETVLDVLRERGRRGLPLDELYRQLFNPQLYLLAYGRIYSNKGAMTPGPDAETADGMTMGKIERIIDALRHERYRFKPVRRHYIPKKDGKQRPLGLPSWTDKLVAEYRRLRYVRYADDTLLGYTGPKAEAEEIKRRLARFLQEDLKLELSETKTLITHARTSAARFLGYEITAAHDNRKLTAGRRSVNGRIRLHVPAEVIKAKCARHMRRGKPDRSPGLMNEQDYVIISRYGAEYRGIVQYYLLAGNVWRLNRLHWVMLTSLLKTLAGKYDSSVPKIARRGLPSRRDRAALVSRACN